MECNKDEAVRAKEIAEKKFEAKDYLGAKKFTLKAQSLYPNLEGIQQMLTTLDVYVSSENRVNGEIDWYKVLDVNPNADEETIRKQYRKLALVLHPDKNRSIGAEGSFKLISEAWNLLSDKTKRSVFDQKIKAQKGKATKRTRKAPNGTTTKQKYQITPTFWTVCHRCRMQHEYLRIYLHNNILCAVCNFPFYAYEYPPPPHIPKMPPQWHDFVKKQGSSNQTSSQSGSFSQQALDKAKKEQEEKLKAMKRDREVDLENKNLANAAKKRKLENSKGLRTQGAKISSSEQDKGGKKTKPKSAKEFPKPEITRKVLVERAKLEIKKKLYEWNLNDSKKDNSVDSDLKSISVPDSDFHDFDKDRTETCFCVNQVWAVYDNDDGMPRYYAIIHEVISVKPFKVRISWLNSKTNKKLGASSIKTCGDFRIGKRVINESLNSFSHKVRWTKGEEGTFWVFPKRGDVWALYRHWSPNKVIHEYDMVEVLEDYDEELGVSVSPLIKVAGFKTVFHKNIDESKTKLIPKEEIFCFSHQVPSVLLSGKEGENAPKGCLELDPAATPLELLQVISDGNGENI